MRQARPIESEPVFRRQEDIFRPDDAVDLNVDIVGAGALGGGVLLCLLKMGFGIENVVRIWDFDRCELHNVPNQWFRETHVGLGQTKVEALAEMAIWVCGREIVTFERRFTGAEPGELAPVVILTVDSLEERRRIWQNLKVREDVRFLVDVRMGAEVLELYCLDRDRDPPDFYESSLDDEGEPFEEPCTRRAILYTVLGAASFVGSVLRAYARGETYPRRIAFDFRNFLISHFWGENQPNQTR
jgi:molybdopterin/thiamine biosynthesis adenylyltransferase